MTSPHEQALAAAVREHDREEAAMRGEPDPWGEGQPDPVGDEWNDRIACMDLAITAYLAALPAPDLAGKHERYMRAYFHEFTPTGVDAVDAVLEAIALAGKGYHYTGDWTDADQYGPDGYWSLIQLVANNAAVAFRSLSAKLAAAERERDTLTERLAEMEAAR